MFRPLSLLPSSPQPPSLSSPLASHPGYRPEVDGLRAVAVLAVVLFHAFPGLLPGGFIGVDMFFVISGYLITGIILAGLNQGDFSFARFYARRMRRIFPALLLVLAAVFATGWQVLLEDEFRQLGRHVVAGAAFLSNFQLWKEVSYFDVSAETKPLLHLWSLGIEEQYYIVWPALLWCAVKLRSSPGVVALGLMGLSFVANIHGVQASPGTTFYWPHTRFWELLAGSVLAWWGLRRTLANRTVGELAGAPTRGAAWPSANLQAWTGLVLIAVGLALISKQSAFPGWWALLPVCGTVLLIAAGPAAWVNRVLLSSRLMVGAGLISYPLYLWHWPMLSFANILMLGQVPSWLRAGLVLASVLLAWATYRWVELPVRFGATGVLARMRIPALAAAMSLLAVGAYVSYKLPAFPQGPVAREARFLNDYSIDYFRQQSVEDLFADQGCARSIARFEQDGTGEDEGRDCRSQYPGRPTVMLVGDSHAIFLQLGLMPYLSARQINFAAFSSSTCVPFAAENAMARLEQQLKCRKVNADLEEKVRTMKPELLIIFAHYLGRGQSADGGAYEYSGYLDALRSGLATSTGTRDILVLGQMPTWNGGLPKALARNFRNTGL